MGFSEWIILIKSTRYYQEIINLVEKHNKLGNYGEELDFYAILQNNKTTKQKIIICVFVMAVEETILLCLYLTTQNKKYIILSINHDG